MTVENPTEVPHRRYDPLLDEGRRPGKGLSTGAIVGIIISIVVHAGPDLLAVEVQVPAALHHHRGHLR